MTRTGDLSVSPNCRARSHYERVHRDADQVPNPLRRRTSLPKYEPIQAIKGGPGGVDGFELPGVKSACPECLRPFLKHLISLIRPRCSGQFVSKVVSRPVPTPPSIAVVGVRSKS